MKLSAKLEKKFNSFRFWGIWTLTGACEIPILSILILDAGKFSWTQAVGFHFIGSLLLFFAPDREGGWVSPKRHWKEVFFLWSFLLPLIGWLLCGATRIISSHIIYFEAPTKPLMEADEEYFFSEEDTPQSLENRKDGDPDSLHEMVDVMPAVDALLGSDLNLRRGAIQTLGKIRTPDSVSWLLKARSNPDADIRFFATQTITSLKRDYEQQIKATEEEILESRGENNLKLALARVYYEYAISGLVDEIRKAQLLSLSESTLGPLGDQAGEGRVLHFNICRQSDPKKALEMADSILGSSTTDEVFWYRQMIELSFQLQEYSVTLKNVQKLKKVLEANSGAAPALGILKNREWNAVLHWWSYD